MILPISRSSTAISMNNWANWLTDKPRVLANFRSFSHTSIATVHRTSQRYLPSQRLSLIPSSQHLTLTLCAVIGSVDIGASATDGRGRVARGQHLPQLQNHRRGD